MGLLGGTVGSLFIAKWFKETGLGVSCTIQVLGTHRNLLIFSYCFVWKWKISVFLNLARMREHVTYQTMATNASVPRVWKEKTARKVKETFQLVFVKANRHLCGDAVTEWLTCFTLDQVVRLRAIAGVTMFCTVTVPLFSQVYKQVPVHLLLGEGVMLRRIRSPSTGGRGRLNFFPSLHATERG